MSQRVVDNLRLSVIRKCKFGISLLEKERDRIKAEIKTQNEYLIAYQKTIPTVESMEDKS